MVVALVPVEVTRREIPAMTRWWETPVKIRTASSAATTLAKATAVTITPIDARAKVSNRAEQERRHVAWCESELASVAR